MALFRCKMCGGTLEINPDSSIAVCEYCGTKQTVPKADDEKKLNLFNRANRLRFANEFDKAAGVYESIVTEFPEEAEAYWGLVLCKFGIEYVDDPRTLTKIPTCHRSSYQGIFDDVNFDMVMEYADSVSRDVYREEAKKIEELRKDIIAVSSKEDPYDIFICYKETDDTGNRTIDSVLAQDIYTALTEKGYRVFFSRITLEDKLGQEYEPYIFAALNSAKVMLAVGTKYEYYNAVWVKNEWSRYLELIAKGEKKILIPCYKDIDAYDMPKEFAHLQAQDMGKIGFIQDLVRGIQKIMEPSDTKAEITASSVDNSIIDMTLGRAKEFLARGDFKSAELSINSVRGYDPTNAMALIYKFMLENKLNSIEQLADLKTPLETNEDFKAAVMYAEEKLKNQLDEYNTATLYNYAVDQASKNTVASLKTAVDTLERIPEYKDSISKSKDYQGKLEIVKKADEKKSNTIKSIIAVVLAVIVGVTGFTLYQKNQRIKTEANQLIRSIKNTAVGNSIRFGNYYTNDDEATKGSRGRWTILVKEDDRALLYSSNIVYTGVFAENDNSVTWEASYVRKWLNNEYYDNAFSDIEKKLILDTTLHNGETPETTDKCFVLSESEYELYEPKYYRNCWLRDVKNGLVSCVNDFSGIDDTYYYRTTVRAYPAIWVTLEEIK